MYDTQFDFRYWTHTARPPLTEHSQLTIHIDSAWQPGWVGTDKTRTLKLDHGMLSIVTEPMISPVDGKTYISTTTFRRVE